MGKIEHVEVLTLVLGLLVLGFALYERRRLSEVPGARCLFAAYGLLVVSWTASVVESLVWPTALDWVQHLTSVAAALLVLAWAVRFGRTTAEERP